ncbi:MAG: hypothetical protein AAF950_05140 [Pseudomonadota bacterium]
MGAAGILTPSIEIVATSPRLEMLKTRLRALGFGAHDHSDPKASPEPLLIDLASASTNDVKAAHQQVLRGVDRPFIIVGGDAPLRLEGAIVLPGDAYLEHLSGKLRRYYRRRDAERETQLRASNVEAISGFAPKKGTRTKPRLLFVGGGSIRFLALQTALKGAEIDVVTAFTMPMALDHLAAQSFTAVVMDLHEDSGDFTGEDLLLGPHGTGPAQPLFCLGKQGFEPGTEDHPLVFLASEIIDSDRPLEEVSEELLQLTFHHHGSAPLAASDVSDTKVRCRLTGLFTPNFFETHLGAQLRQSEHALEPLTLITLSLSSKGDNNAAARRALPEIAQKLNRHVRQTDCAARLDWTTLGISLRRTAYLDATRLVERYAASQIEAGMPESISLAWRVCEKRRTHSASSLIAAAIATPQIRSAIPVGSDILSQHKQLTPLA